MVRLFKSKGEQQLPLPCNLEYLYFHIPKTGGTSFNQVLRDGFGEKNVWNINIPIAKPELVYRIQKSKGYKAEIPDHVKIMHGHFNWFKINQVLQLPDQIKCWTWLRNPVDLVISTYNFQSYLFEELIQREKVSTNQIINLKRNIMEFASHRRNQNIMSAYMKDLSLNSFDFIGILEHQEEDLAYLAKKMNWTLKPSYRENRTMRKMEPVSEQERKQIALWNQKDMDLFNLALALRKKRT